MEIWIELYIMLSVFIIGTLFGSFFSLATYRIPRKKDIVCTRSFCPTCHHNLGFFDLIPVLSYLFQGGKCNYCKQKISIRYPIYELSSGLFFLFVFLVFKFSFTTLILYIAYVIVVLTIGITLSKKQLKEQPKQQKEKKKKAGFIVVEVVIAFIIFTLIVSSVYVTSQNALNKAVKESVKSEAFYIALRNNELSLGTKYDSLESKTYQEKINNVTYHIEIAVTKYSDEFINKKDIIKQIRVLVRYTYQNEENSVTISSIKKRI